LLGAPLTVESAEGLVVVDGFVPVAGSERICCQVPGTERVDVEDMMRRFANNLRYSEVYFKHDGAPVLTTFAGG
jgi:hypothetical protein